MIITLILLQSIFSTLEMEAHMLQGQGLTPALILFKIVLIGLLSSGNENEPTIRKRKSSKNLVFLSYLNDVSILPHQIFFRL